MNIKLIGSYPVKKSDFNKFVYFHNFLYILSNLTKQGKHD